MEKYVLNREDRRKYVKVLEKLDEKIPAMKKTIEKLKEERSQIKKALKPLKKVKK